MGVFSTCKKLVKNCSFIKGVYRAPFFNDEPQLYSYSTILTGEYAPEDILGGGTSLNKTTAYVKSVMEGVERYLLVPKDKDLKEWKELSLVEIENNTDLEFNSFLKFSPEQLKGSNFARFVVKDRKVEVKCCEVKDIITNKSICYPSQFFYLPYYEEGQLFRLPISTGAATDFDDIKAIKKGIYEVVERDQFITSYLGKICGTKIKFHGLPEEIKAIVDEFSFYKLNVYCILLQSDIPIPTVLTVLEDSTGIGPLYTLGMKCSPNLEIAMKGSLEEAFHSRRWLRYNQVDNKRLGLLWKNRKSISEILDRGLMWSSEKVRGRLDFWIKNRKEVSYSEIKTDFVSEVNSLDCEISMLKKKKWHCFVKTFHDDEANAFNVSCVKVFIPEAHPLYLDENYPYFETSRIKDVLDTTVDVKVNKFLQPFL